MMNVDLISIQNIINEIGLKATLLEKSEVIRLATLGVSIDADDSKRERNIFMNFIPLPEDVFADIKLLQLHIELPFAGLKKSQAGLEALFNFINLNSPIGTFSIDDRYKITLRYVHTLNKYQSLSETGPLLLELLKFLIFTLDTYSDLIELVTNSIRESDDVINELREML